MTITRRDFVAASLLAACVPRLRSNPFPTMQAAGKDAMTTEAQRGDPGTHDEYVTYDREGIASLSQLPSTRANFETWDPNLPTKMASASFDYVGLSRDTSRERIAAFLSLFGLPFSDEHGDLAFCAAGLSYCALKIFRSTLGGMNAGEPSTESLRKIMPDLEHYYFLPTVSCVDMYYAALSKHRWIEKVKSVRPKGGWIVLYAWAGRETPPNHCGIVIDADDHEVHTVEFNTSGTAGGSQRNGGTVSEKHRGYEFVKGYIRPPSH